MRYRFAVAVFVLAGVFVGCGGGDDRHTQRVVAPRTGRFEMTIVATGPGQNASLRATGSFDDDRHLFSLVTDFSGFVPGLDGPMAMVATPDAVFVDCAYLTRLLGASTRWIKVSGAGGERLRTSIVEALQVLGFVPGAGGLVPRTAMRFAGGGNEDGVLVSLEYFDVGAPVVIEPPAADQVTDETDAVNRLFGGTTGG
jgi:hypothetical protein